MGLDHAPEGPKKSLCPFLAAETYAHINLGSARKSGTGLPTLPINDAGLEA